MATRTIIGFGYGVDAEPLAFVYRHWDGNPDTCLPDLADFFREVALLNDTRFDHPEYLAAKFVVWYSNLLREHMSGAKRLDFLGLGVVSSYASVDDTEYEYLVTPPGDGEEFPRVYSRYPGGTKWIPAPETEWVEGGSG